MDRLRSRRTCAADGCYYGIVECRLGVAHSQPAGIRVRRTATLMPALYSQSERSVHRRQTPPTASATASRRMTALPRTTGPASRTIIAGSFPSGERQLAAADMMRHRPGHYTLLLMLSVYARRHCYHHRLLIDGSAGLGSLIVASPRITNWYVRTATAPHCPHSSFVL